MTNAHPVINSKLKLIEPMQNMITGEKFLKWTEPANEKLSCFPVGITLKIDEKGFILYWRELNQKSGFIDLSLIRDVRTGQYASKPKDEKIAALLTSGKSNVPVEDKTITIVFGTDYANLQIVNFVAMTEYPLEVARIWTDYIFKAAKNQRMQNLSPLDCIQKLRAYLLYVKGIYDEKKQTYSIPVQTLIDFFSSTNNQFSIKYEKDKFSVTSALKTSDLPHRKSELIDSVEFTIKHFMDFFINLVDEDKFDDVFIEYGGSKKNCLNGEQFSKFINNEQRYSGLNELLHPFCRTSEANSMIAQFEINEYHKRKNILSLGGLINYLMEFENDIIDPVRYDQFDDMDQPLTDYFINSSHNTYLTGPQIGGRSDVEMYRYVLLSGCRCIELDCHEDELKIEPMITHGRSLCTKILFTDVIRVINDSAFKTSPYPVILSFENYCGTKIREKMVKYMIDIFGEKLLIEPLENHELIPGCKLPSPEQMKYKILIKFSVKNPKKIEKTDNFDIIPESDGSDDDESVQDTDSPHGSQKKNSISSQMSTCILSYDMKNLVNYVTPLKFHTFELSEKMAHAYNVSSFSESSAAKLIRESPIDFIRLTQRQFARIYPKGSRIYSDNFLPHTYWMAGSQMVALNFQTLDIGMQLNNGKFEMNNRTGYLLKPVKLRSSFQLNSFNPYTQNPIDGIVGLRMKIKVLNGIFIDLNAKRLGETVTLEIFGLPHDSAMGSKAHRVNASSKRNFNVSFSDSGFEIPRIIYPELALLKITAYDQSSKTIGSRILPMDSLRAGYRYVCLKNTFGQPTLMNVLLLHIKIQDYVAHELEDLASALMNPGVE